MVKVTEIFGMRVDLELVAKNIKQVRKQVGDAMKNIPAGISEGAFGGGGAGGGAGGGIGKLIGKTTLVIGALLVIGEGVKRLVGILKESSPYLKGVFDIFKRAMMIFFRPFGDFLASLLKPLALLLMKVAVQSLKESRAKAGEVGVIEQVAAIPQALRIKEGLPDEIGQEILNGIIEGKQSFVGLPTEMRDKFFGWLLENADQIKLLPEDVRNNILDWIGENRNALMGISKKVADAFGADLTRPAGMAMLAKIPGNFADMIRLELENNKASITNLPGEVADFFSGALTTPENRAKVEGVIDKFVAFFESLLPTEGGGTGGVPRISTPRFPVFPDLPNFPQPVEEDLPRTGKGVITA